MICPTCGETISEVGARCPYCESPLEAQPEPRSGIRQINLKEDRPTVQIARDRLDAAIQNAVLRNLEGLVIIHGWGSSGTGGAIKEMVLERLSHLKFSGDIRDFVPGEVLGPRMAKRLPTSYRMRREDVGNRGITVVLV